jgi:hypothetical protein
MPSTRGFAGRRRGVRDSRLPPVHNDASTDVSVQYGEAFTPARSCAGSYWGEGLGRVWRPRRISPGSGRSAARGPEVRNCFSRALTSEELH